jgi:hypothetical protein
MTLVRGVLAVGMAVSLASGALAGPGVSLPPEVQSFLEGEWHGVTVDTNANKLCTPQTPEKTVFAIEFAKTGGLAFFDNGVQEDSGRREIVSASMDGKLMVLQLKGQVQLWAFRKDGPDRMALVRDSASLGMAVDTMAFKRCKPAADRSQIGLGAEDLRRISSDMPGDFPYFIDTRIAAKLPDACKAAQVQYVFLGLAGPVEFRLSRWNSFDLTDALDAGKKPAVPLDPVGDWRIVSAAKDPDGVVKVQARPYEDDAAAPATLTLAPRPGGGLSIPEWGREYVRCTGFDQRS